MGWQWVAGCGVDAAPYFRVFNPITQGERFDPEGTYVRRWVPELVGLPNEWIHKPWEAPPLMLVAARVQLGANYPRPLVDHAEARRAALSAFQEMKQARRER
jgi:deoxyribodipyrimidine photo-lyase